MGYACPDSGPGGTANCDPTQGGFFQQVYRAAWQLKVYRAFPNSYNYKPFQNNTIQWHPNASCGTSSVRIENWATAALYIYTPYRPNQAALNAGWGTGDGCSSYGNRNFYNYYRAWFGTPSGPPVAQELVAFYESLGGSNGFLGAPTGTASVYNNGGLGQGFQGGSMYWSNAAGASAVKGAVRAEYWDSGSWSGPLGFPRATENQIPGGGVVQQFQGGTIYWSHATGAYHVRGAIRTAYVASGETNGPLRFPIGRERSLAGGAMQEFQSGTIYWKHATGGVPVRGAVRSALLTSGGVDVLGYPMRGEVSAPSGGVQQEFEFATVFWTHASGAHPMRGAMRAAYVAAGGPQSSLLYPTSTESRYATGGAGQGFQSGSMYWHPDTGAHPVRAAVRKAFWDAGSIAALGFPLSGENSTPAGGVEQHFQKGSIYWRHDVGAYPVQGPALSAYQGAKGTGGALGFPIAVATRTADGGTTQRFERGIITVDKFGNARVAITASSPLARGDEQAAVEPPEDPGAEVGPGVSSEGEDDEGGIGEEALNQPHAAQ
ncbi:LGFP repeat-containing protein [Leucobacter komagatae]|uniref:LGFP repeat-containing protein n=1 Tax=Leucobacter komagatae TaxID=55969 RepID=UPI000A03D2F3